MTDDNETWNDSMAYLVEQKGKNTHLEKLTTNTNRCKGLLKCGFVITGRPKKVWALQIENATIEEDINNKKWFKIGDKILMTNKECLEKYILSVQHSHEFGMDHIENTNKIGKKRKQLHKSIENNKSNDILKGKR